jgi:hypothetical protein
MCPVCLANLAIIAAGATSTSGLSALAVKKLFFKPYRDYQTNEIGEKQSENRNDETENRQERNQSC